MFEMREHGWDVKGVEPNKQAAEYGSRTKGLNIFPGSLIGAALPAGSFDYVRMNHSFEHMEHPNEILQETYRILDDHGKLMIGVPNRDGWSARLFGRFWYHLALPLHTFSYSVQTLTQMLAKHNFEVEKVVFNTEQTPLLKGVQIYLKRHEASPSFEGRFSRSRAATLICYWAARLQNAFRIADVIEITAVKLNRTPPQLHEEIALNV